MSETEKRSTAKERVRTDMPASPRGSWHSPTAWSNARRDNRPSLADDGFTGIELAAKIRELIARKYSDVIVMTIATAANRMTKSFSADTGMAEALVVCSRTDRSNGATGRGLIRFIKESSTYIAKWRRSEIARAISRIASNGRRSEKPSKTDRTVGDRIGNRRRANR